MSDSTKSAKPTAAKPAKPTRHHQAESESGPVRIDVKVAGIHWLEILTQKQWLDLPSECKPGEYYPYHADCYIRLRPELS